MAGILDRFDDLLDRIQSDVHGEYAHAIRMALEVHNPHSLQRNFYNGRAEAFLIIEDILATYDSAQMDKGDEEITEVTQLPECYECGKPAEFHCRTSHGYWINVCPACFKSMKLHLGLKWGSRLVLTSSSH